MNKDRQHPSRASADPPGGSYAWLKLLVGLALVIFFMFVIAPLGDHVPGFHSMFQFIEEKNLKATALYYTDIDEFGEAAVSIRNSLEYPPENKPGR